MKTEDLKLKISELFESKLKSLTFEKIEELRKTIASEIMEATFKRVNRIRKGKVQLRKKVSTKKGFTFRGGKLVKMSATEKLARKKGQRAGSRKRRSTLSTSLRKRKISLRKRKSKGF